MGPRRAAEIFRQRHPAASKFRITLFGSLAATGKGHLTDIAIQEALYPTSVEIIWKPDELLPLNPNGMQFEAFLADGKVTDPWQVYSLGGGAIGDGTTSQPNNFYDLQSLSEILTLCEKRGQAFWEYVKEREGDEIWSFLENIWQAMRRSINRGLVAEGVLPGMLGIPRKAWAFYRKTINAGEHLERPGLLAAYALAVSEENAAGGEIVTAPTCGSCGVLPSVLRYAGEVFQYPDDSILYALATAGLIGNLIKHNASISGAQVGCQGEEIGRAHV